MAGPVETISFVARRLIQFEQRFASAPEERRRSSSLLFSQISRNIQLLSDILQRDGLPHDPCRELIFLASKMKDATMDELGATESDRLSAVLTEASDKEKVFLEFRASDHKAHLSEELEKASILIQALANGIFMPSQKGPELALSADQADLHQAPGVFEIAPREPNTGMESGSPSAVTPDQGADSASL